MRIGAVNRPKELSMFGRMKSRVSYANVVSALALFVALGGSSYAAFELPANSVGAAQLRNRAVTSVKVRNGSLQMKDLSAGARKALVGPVGPQGPAGLKGDAGPKGDSGAAGVVVRLNDAGVTMAAADATVSAFCKPGERATGGGGGFGTSTGDVLLRQSYPLTGTAASSHPSANGETPAGWQVRLHNNDTTTAQAHTIAYAVCVAP
jgi:hypothetical protein